MAGALLVLAGGCAGIPDVPVPDNPTLNDRFLLGAGGFYSRMNTEARLDSAALGVGANVDFEEDLGLESDEIVPFGTGRFRLDERWRVELEYFQVDRASSGTAGVDLQWGDVVFPIDTGLGALFDVSVLRFSVGYAFFRRRDKELGIALGIHEAHVEAALEDASGNGDTGTVFAPLPVVSLYGGIALTECWSVSARLDAFSLDYDGYSGRLLSNGVDLVYQPFRHVGFGLGYRDLFVDLEVDKGDFRGKVRSDFRGPIAFVSVSF